MNPDRDAQPTVGQRLQQAMATLSPAERRVARVFMSAFPLAGLESVDRLAVRAGVSRPTVVRFANKLGFAGFADLREAVRHEVDARIASPLTVLEEHRSPAGGGIVAEAGGALIAALEATFAGLLEADVAAAADLLADRRRRVAVIGGRYSTFLAWHLYSSLDMVRPGCRHVPLSATPWDDQVGMARRDVVVAFDFHRYQLTTMEYCARAAARGARVLLFTDPWHSPIAEHAHVVLVAQVGGPPPFDSFVPAMAVAGTVVGLVAERLGAAARARIAELDGLQVGATWSGPGRQGATL